MFPPYQKDDTVNQNAVDFEYFIELFYASMKPI